MCQQNSQNKNPAAYINGRILCILIQAPQRRDAQARCRSPGAGAQAPQAGSLPPLFRKAGMEVLAAEEHPFTILETDDYHFRIRFMVSEYPKGKQPKGICSGFFRKAFFHNKETKGYIYDHKKETAIK